MRRFKKCVCNTMLLMFFSFGAGILYKILAKPLSLEQQRDIYQKAQQYLDKQQVEEYLKIRKQISDYPLTPYIDYRTFLVEITAKTPQEVTAFTAQHEEFPFSNRIQAAYLDSLIADNQWHNFYQYQTSEPRMEKYRCGYYYAQLKHGDKQEAFKGAAQLWLSGQSVSDNCDALFDEWHQAGLRSDALILERMLLSFEKGTYNLLNYLAKMPTSEKSIQQAREIKKLAQDPEYVVEFSQKHPATKLNRRKSEIALKKLIRKDIELAHSALPVVFKSQKFSKQQQQQVSDYLAVRLLNTEEEYLAKWRDQVLSASKRVTALEQRIRLAIRQADWKGVSRWITQLPEKESNSLRWQYWLGRAELQQGATAEGTIKLQQILGQRNFYSVAAAKVLDEPITYQSSAERPDKAILQPYYTSLKRINELIEINKLTAAKSEWSWLLGRVKEEERKALAVYATDKQWYHLAVKATIEAKMWDNTALRFPIAYQQWFDIYGKKHNIDPITLISLARQESAMDSTARSPVGARGIMQIMPKTATYTAKKYNISYKGVSDLYDVAKNIEIGAQYLSSLLEQYNNNRIFALAAYNAGPSRVKRWREKTNQKLDVFAFIEAIPFKETRGYVQNILMFEIYYRDLMQVEGHFLQPHEMSMKY